MIDAQKINKDVITSLSYEELYHQFNHNFYETEKAKTYANSYLRKAKLEHNIMKIESGKYFLSLINNDFDSYYTLCDSLITVSKKRNDIYTEMKIRCAKGETYFNRNLSSKTLKEFLIVNTLLQKKKSDSIQSLANIFIGLIKWNDNEHQETINLFKKVDTYLDGKNPNEFNDLFLSNPMHLANLYTELKKKDSASYYLTKAENIYNSINDPYFKKALHLLKSKIAIDNKEYEKAISELKIFIPYLKNIKNFNLLTTSFSRIATCYEKIENTEKAYVYHLKADSLFTIKKIPNPHLEASFLFLSNYYKEENNYKKQLEYINKLLTINQIKTEEEKETIKVLLENYDQPKLLAEKNAVIHKLEQKNTRDKLYKTLYTITIIIIFLILIFQTNRKQNYKKEFLKLINDDAASTYTQNSNEKTIVSHQETYQISDTVSKDLLTKLANFEKKKAFLNAKINLKYLADDFDTNSSYLSKTINQHKNLTFTNYIHQLRINFIVEELKHNTVIQKYTVKALAEETGFKSAESFSKAFYKFTNVKPSYFIKELKKIEHQKT